MKKRELDEVLYCLGNDKRVVYYHKDRYCLDLILWYMEGLGKESVAVKELKQWRRFAEKPLVQEILKSNGSKVLSRDNLKFYYAKDALAFTLSLSRWGSGARAYDQTSRNQENLVLQINFDNRHNQLYEGLLKPYDHYGPFECRSHPIRRDHRKTLAWARLDFDLSTGEALIEEVQNDWLRSVESEFARFQNLYKESKEIKSRGVVYGIDCQYQDFKKYAELMQVYQKIWAELSLWAAIQFIRKELGLSTIYYHTFDTGKKIKKIVGLPPKSMYTKLPKQFGFEKTSQSPVFLTAHKHAKRYLKSIKNAQWHLLRV